MQRYKKHYAIQFRLFRGNCTKYELAYWLTKDGLKQTVARHKFGLDPSYMLLVFHRISPPVARTIESYKNDPKLAMPSPARIEAWRYDIDRRVMRPTGLGWTLSG